MKAGYNCFYVQLWCLTWYKDMLTSRREMSHRGGGRWSLEQACVWEPSVIHTLLIPIQLCSIKSLRHFTKRGALFGVLWVFVSESLKKKKTPRETNVRFICFHLTDQGFIIYSFSLFYWLKTPWRKKSEILSVSPGIEHKTMLHS